MGKNAQNHPRHRILYEMILNKIMRYHNVPLSEEEDDVIEEEKCSVIGMQFVLKVEFKQFGSVWIKTEKGVPVTPSKPSSSKPVEKKKDIPTSVKKVVIGPSKGKSPFVKISQPIPKPSRTTRIKQERKKLSQSKESVKHDFVIDPTLTASSSSSSKSETAKSDKLEEVKLTEEAPPAEEVDLETIAAIGCESVTLLESVILSDKEFESLMAEAFGQAGLVEEEKKKERKEVIEDRIEVATKEEKVE
ncbi:hypothetical protein ACLOJK_040889 [Asimina triloba]